MKHGLFKSFLFLFVLLGVGVWNLTAFAKPPLWKLQDEDTTIYLLGTFHILDKETVWYTHEIDDALKASDALYIEITLEELDGIGAWDYIKSRGFFPNGTYLTDYLSEQEFYHLQELISQAGGQSHMVFRMKPMLAAGVLSGAPVGDGFKRVFGAEEVLIRRAQKFRIPLKGMEDLKTHMDAGYNYSAEDQLKYLRATMKSAEKGFLKIDDYIQAWVDGNLEKLDVNEEENLAEFPEFQEKLLFERNRNWVVKIKEMMTRPGQIFIAVGAGHFVGQQNVIELLEKEGFKPKRQ